MFVIATTVDTSDLHLLLSVMHVFGETVPIKAMNSQARQLVSGAETESGFEHSYYVCVQVLKELISKRSNTSPPDLDYSTLAQMAEGYTPADVRDLVDNAVQQMIVRVMDETGSVGHASRYTCCNFSADHEVLPSSQRSRPPILRKPRTITSQDHSGMSSCKHLRWRGQISEVRVARTLDIAELSTES